MAGIYCADIYCDDCIDDIKRRIAIEVFEGKIIGGIADLIVINEYTSYDDVVNQLDRLDERDYDSDEYPKWCDEEGESDCPQHCGSGQDCLNPYVHTDGEKYGYFFGNPLTSHGDEYVKETVRDDRLAGHTDSVACMLWACFYDYIDFGPEDFCVECNNWDELDDNELCPGCEINDDCAACEEFFDRFSCNRPDECDCPPCQGTCECDA